MAEVLFDREQLLQLIQRDCEVALSFYLGDELTLGVPDFHEEIWGELLDLLDEINEPGRLVGVLRKLIGVPREHAKTTLIKVAIILFMRYSPLRFTAYMSNTYPSARNALIDVVRWLQSPQEIELYGAPIKEKHTETEGLFIYHIRVPGRVKPKRIILKAFGVDTQIRGMLIDQQRPDLMIFDDVESRETASSEQQQAKLDGNILGTAMKAMAKLGVAIFIGNMISKTTLLARLAKEPKWRATVFGCIIRDKNGDLRPLWPERWSLDDLFADYAEYRNLGVGHLWEAELMNLTSEDIFGVSMEACPRPPRPMPEDLQYGFITLDPAFGENNWNDNSAITVHAKLIGGDIPVVIDSWYGRVNDERLFEEMLAMSFKWGIATWCIESVAAQKLLFSLFRMYMIQRGLSPETFLMLPMLGGKASKVSRILAFRDSCANGSYAIVEEEEELKLLIEAYTPAVKDDDDRQDSAAYGLICHAQMGEVIKSQGRVDIAGMLLGTGGDGRSIGESEMRIP